MIFQAELKDTYWGADGAFRMFQEAQEKLSRTTNRGTESNNLIASPSVAVSHPIAALTPTSNDFGEGDMIPSIDDILTFDFAFIEPQDFSINGIDYP